MSTEPQTWPVARDPSFLQLAVIPPGWMAWQEGPTLPEARG